jgi:M6 family metalloprotease-like protein
MATGLWLAGGRVFAITASPDATEVAQPNGSRLTLHVRGDEYGHWYEDARGFTVVRDAARQYVYARLDSGGRLAPTALPVETTNPAAMGLSRGIRPPPATLEALRGQNVRAAPQLQQGAAAGTAQENALPATVLPSGTVKNLVVLCKFADHVLGTHTRPQADYDILFNNAGSNATLAPTGSVKDYFREASYGVLTLQSTVVVWVTLPQIESYYAAGKDGTSGTYPRNAQGMVRDALNLVDPLVDFGQFDQDNDGYIDSISIIHSGYGAETGGGNGNWIWSHRWSLDALPGGKWTSNDTNGAGVHVKVYDYHTEPALWGTSGTIIVRIGVICHETGHFFGLPDLYDTDGSSEGIGSWCLMANSWGFDGSQLHPPHLSAWCKTQLGWVTPTVISSGPFSLTQVETSPSVYKITAGYPSNEYLLVENRQPAGMESDIPQGGLAVWHIDENQADNNNEGYPGQSGWPTNNKHYKIALLQADGLFQMEKGSNRGNSGDMFRGGGVSAITPATVPDTNCYQGGVVTSSNNSISNIGSSGASMSFTLNTTSGVPIITSATSVTAPPSAAFSYQIVATNSPTSYTATGLPAGLTVNTTSGLITGSTPATTGSYAVTLNAKNSKGTGTTVMTLAISPVLTLAGALDTTGMTWTTGGNSNWTAQSVTSHDGQDAAQSGALGNSQLGYIETTVTGPGALSFWWSVSSEAGYDFLRFKVDGAEPGGIAGISGDMAWQYCSLSVASGSHVLRWEYSKDYSTSFGSDAGWVDQVAFVTGAQKPTITSVTADTGTPGQPYCYQITASNAPTSYGASNLPGGLSINPASGRITGTPTSAGTFKINLSATNAIGTGPTATLTLTTSSLVITLANAMDQPALTFTSAATQPWTAQTTTTHDGVDAAKSGTIPDYQTSVMQTTVTGPGLLSFYWKVSSEASCDLLLFYLDGIKQSGEISGESGWQPMSYTLTDGSHTLKWVYSKDSGDSSGSDCGWVDQLSLSPTTPPTVVRFDLNSDPGWTRQGEWAFGTPTGGGGKSGGNPDPTSGATGTNVFGINLGGDYANAVSGASYLTMGPINLANYANTQLRFKRWLNTDFPGYVYATIDVSNDGSNWTNVFTNSGVVAIADNTWTTQTYPLGSAADHQSTVYVRWGHHVAGSGAYRYSGWNIDDVEVLGTLLAPTITSGSPLPAGAVAAAYNQTLTASGGTTPYSWSVSNGNLPAGLGLSSAGVLSGTPSTAATADFTVQATGHNGYSSTRDFSLTINSALFTWLAAAGISPDQCGPEQTPQQDGVSNLLKFAFNMDPTRPDVRHLIVGQNAPAGLPGGARVGGKLRLEFLRRKASTSPGVTYTPQFSSGVGSWVDFTGTLTGTAVDSAWERVVVDDPSPGTGKRFGRLKVVQAP